MIAIAILRISPLRSDSILSVISQEAIWVILGESLLRIIFSYPSALSHPFHFLPHFKRDHQLQTSAGTLELWNSVTQAFTHSMTMSVVELDGRLVTSVFP